MEELDHKSKDRIERDQGLVNEALAGDQQAYTRLLALYKDNIYFLMLKMVKNKDDADDLTIEAFGKAFKRLGQYRPDFAFSTWLFKIATNNCIDHLRRVKRNKLISIEGELRNEDGETQKLDPKSPGLDPEEVVMKTQRIEEMRRLVAELKPKYRRLVELRYFEEYSYDEIAAELKLPLGTVKAQLFRARELMYEVMKDRVTKI